MNSLKKLQQYFKGFPGIGPRQARRFLYYILHKDEQYVKDFIHTLQEARGKTHPCSRCGQYFYTQTRTSLCDICSDESRDSEKLMVVEHDSDLENIERSGVYNGYYLVLGGTLPILEKNPEKKIRVRDMIQIVKERADGNLSEVIIATSFNPEGEGTLYFLKEKLAPLSLKYGFNIKTLGRGLSTGTELEYIDSETLKNALENRR